MYTGEYIKQGYASTEVIIIKKHGEYTDNNELNSMINAPESIWTKRFNISRSKIRKYSGNITANAIFLIRDPWNAMFALYNFWQGQKRIPSDSRHKKHVSLQDFNKAYFAQMIKRYSNKWNRNIKIMNIWKANNKSFLIIKFENIIDSDTEIATNEMLKIMKYLYMRE
eukprot:182337_1